MTQVSARTERRLAWFGYPIMLLVGLGMGAFFILLRDRVPLIAPAVHLTPIVIASTEILLPDGAHGSGSGNSASWGPVRWARCGTVSQASLFPSRRDLPDGVHICGTYNSYAGGSSDGDCPETTVCFARRGELDLTCESTDESCRTVVATFALSSTEGVR